MIEVNVDMFAGDTKEFYIDVFSDTGMPMDLTNVKDFIWVMSSTILQNGSPELVKSVTNGTVQCLESGQIFLKLTSEDTKNLEGRYYVEGKLIDVMDNVSTILAGEINIKNSIIVAKSLL